MLHQQSTKMTSNLKQNKKVSQNTERRKTSFLKEQVENVNLHKSILNKIMTTQEQCIKYNFVAPLTIP